jgi:hypothetical protein
MTNTTTRQNAVIWSATGGLILVLLSIIGWLAISKDNTILSSINKLGEQQVSWQNEARNSDQKIIDNLSKICDRLGIVEGRVSNLEIFIQMPYPQRQKLFDSFKAPIKNGGK